MIKVRPFLLGVPPQEIMKLLRRQTPEMKGDIYKGIRFVNDNSYTNAIFFDRVFTDDIVTLPNDNFCFLMEPPEICRPQTRNINKISRFYSFNEEDKKILGDKFRYLEMQNLLQTEVLNDDKLVPSKKFKKISVVVSNKSKTRLQKKRIQVVQHLLEMGFEIDVYGRDFTRHRGGDKRIKGPLPHMNKQEALKAYQYSLAFENSTQIGYLSEKFFDCVVNNCIPITNNGTAKKYFSKEGFFELNFNDPVPKIAHKIVEICKKVPNVNNDKAVLEIKKQILKGKWNIVENVYRAVTGQI